MDLSEKQVTREKCYFLSMLFLVSMICLQRLKPGAGRWCDVSKSLGGCRMVSRASRRPNDSAFLPVVGISKEGEIFDFSTCFFLAVFESLLVCV